LCVIGLAPNDFELPDESDAGRRIKSPHARAPGAAKQG
jgi:hypothetical protein